MSAEKKTRAGRLLITGATGGMGRVCAQLAAAAGYDLVLADLSAEKLETIAAGCAQHGADIQCHTLDVTRPDSIAALTQTLLPEREAGKGLDALIHTVGVSPQMASWDRIIDIDLVGTAAFLEAAFPTLNAGACAVVISSMSAYMAPPNADIERVLAAPLAPGLMDALRAIPGQTIENPGLAYSYAKRALKQYVGDQAANWGSQGKRIVSISPGLIDTEMGRLENDAMENFEAMRSRVALDRLGKPEDIANTALFLLSDKAAYITGCDLLVDGGFVGTLNREMRQRAGS